MKKVGRLKRFVKSNFLTIVSALGALVSYLILRARASKIAGSSLLRMFLEARKHNISLDKGISILFLIFIVCIIIFVISLFGVRKRMMYSRVADIEKYMQNDVTSVNELYQNIPSDKDKPKIMPNESNMNLF